MLRTRIQRPTPWRVPAPLALVMALTALLTAELAPAADWPNEKQSGRFIVRADFDLAGLESRFVELANLEQDLTQALALPQARQDLQPTPIELYLFESEAAYRRHIAQALPNPPDRRALYVQSGGRGRVYAFRTRNLPTDLRHECTHALLHAGLAKVPLWLDEGLAEYFETPAGKRTGSSPHLAEMRHYARNNNKAPALSQMERLTNLQEMSTDDYRDAWAWVHFLLHDPSDARQVLVEYLRDLSSDQSPGPLSTRLERRWTDLDSRFLRHFR